MSNRAVTIAAGLIEAAAIAVACVMLSGCTTMGVAAGDGQLVNKAVPKVEVLTVSVAGQVGVDLNLLGNAANLWMASGEAIKWVFVRGGELLGLIPRTTTKDLPKTTTVPQAGDHK